MKLNVLTFSFILVFVYLILSKAKSVTKLFKVVTDNSISGINAFYGKD